MIEVPHTATGRTPNRVELESDLVVAGGGLAGTCAAITAARGGIRVVLIQDRPVLGGNASSEVRLWILGATSHMGNNNRWAREGGVVDEIMVENMHRNPEGNAVLVDALLPEKVREESNITLLLNTAVDRVEKRGADTIAAVEAFCSQNQTRYTVRAPLYCDASGDGIVAFLAGAPFRMGAEKREEFGEGFAPTHEYGELLGHLYFYSKDTGKPVEFTPPSFALPDIKVIPRYRDIKASDTGARFWWFEYGGRRDTVHDTEEIKWELWRVAWGAWNYIKNSGRFPEAKTFTLEWMGLIPGKRESRRFEGDYLLKQQDLIEQRIHADAVSHGGWAIDLHPGDGVQRTAELHAVAREGRVPDPVPVLVQPVYSQPVSGRAHDQRFARGVRLDSRNGDVRARCPGRGHGRSAVFERGACPGRTQRTGPDAAPPEGVAAGRAVHPWRRARGSRGPGEAGRDHGVEPHRAGLAATRR
jgi:FAD dependent oxidoreductase